MAKPKTNREGLDLVFSKISRPELAAALDVTKQALYQNAWKYEVPFKYLLDVERITGIPRDCILPETAAVFTKRTAT